MNKGFERLGKDIQNIVLRLESGETRLSEILTAQHEMTRQLEDIDLGVTKLQSSSDQRIVLESLFFPELFHRLENVKNTHPKTYEWALETPEELFTKSPDWEPPSWPNLNQ